MKDGLIPGLTHQQIYATSPEMRARQLSSDVLSTPAMIGLMERTCVDFMESYLGENEQTVGIHVDVSHLAPTKIGQSVTVAVEFLELKGNKLRFGVSAFNDLGVKIGEGSHRRALVNVKQFASEEDGTSAQQNRR